MTSKLEMRRWATDWLSGTERTQHRVAPEKLVRGHRNSSGDGCADAADPRFYLTCGASWPLVFFFFFFFFFFCFFFCSVGADLAAVKQRNDTAVHRRRPFRMRRSAISLFPRPGGGVGRPFSLSWRLFLLVPIWGWQRLPLRSLTLALPRPS